MELLDLLKPDEFKVFLLILVRVSVVLFLFPFFSSSTFPTLAKAGLALILSFLLYPVVAVTPDLFPETSVHLVILMFSEVLIGLALGLSLNIFFAGVKLAGQIIGFQMGFTMINVVDPQSGENISIMEQIAYWVALLIFLALNGHHSLFFALLDSFKLIQIGLMSFQGELVEKLITLSSDIFIIGIKIAAPVMAALLFTTVAFGITAKFAPQMNVMIVAFPLKIMVGLMLFGAALQIILYVCHFYVSGFDEILTTLLVRMSSG